MNNLIVLENIRSAYNVGNIVRTADALGWDVLVAGYTPSPITHPKVKKTSLGAEESVVIREEWDVSKALVSIQQEGYCLLAAEITSDSLPLREFVATFGDKHDKKEVRQPYALIMGNEPTGVRPETLALVDYVVHIPMLGQKASLNVGQAAAIFMRELGKNDKE